jgi:hypothetical protein
MPEDKWAPQVPTGGYPEELTIEEWIGQAIGSASMCWEFPERAGVFDDAYAKRISDSLTDYVRGQIRKAVAAAEEEHLSPAQLVDNNILAVDVGNGVNVQMDLNETEVLLAQEEPAYGPYATGKQLMTLKGEQLGYAVSSLASGNSQIRRVLVELQTIPVVPVKKLPKD